MQILIQNNQMYLPIPYLKAEAGKIKLNGKEVIELNLTVSIRSMQANFITLNAFNEDRIEDTPL